MTPFLGTRSLALGTEVGAHFGRQDGPNLGARNPFYESAFRGAGAGMRVPIRPWCGSLGVVSAGAMGGACSALDIFKASWVRIHGLGSNALHCCSRRSGPVKVLVGGVLRRCARSSRQGRWRVRRSIFLFRILFKYGHTPCNGQDPRVFSHIFGAQNENHKVYGITKFAGVDTVFILSVCRRLAALF